MSGLQTLFRNDFPDQQQLLLKLLGDVEALYRGEWQQWQRCQVAYHNINHIHAVTMVAMQIYAGECERYQRAVRTDQIKVLAAAALFHDCGYLKAVGDDSKGSGGQYTFEHVERSQRLVWDYLKTQQGWTQSERRAVVAAIGKTKIVNVDEQQHLAEPVFADLGDMLASADLLAQVADENYLDRLPLLYAEFSEAYEALGRDYLAQHGFMVFDSYAQLLDTSADFIRNRVLPRLQELGRREDALQCYFGQQPSPCMQQLLMNLQHIEILTAGDK